MVLSLAHRFVMVNPIAAADALQDFRFFLEMIRRNENGYRLADNLLRSISKDPLRTAIPARNDAIQILADDRIVRRFDDGREKRGGLQFMRFLAHVPPFYLFFPRA